MMMSNAFFDGVLLGTKAFGAVFTFGLWGFLLILIMAVIFAIFDMAAGGDDDEID